MYNASNVYFLLLTKHEIDVNVRTNLGWTVLLFAAKTRTFSIDFHLPQKGADLGARV
jgi:hypothetical protein